MASYKRIVLTEHDSAPTATINSDVKKQLNRFDTTYTSKKLNELYNEFDAMAVNNETVNSTIVKKNAVDTVDVYAKEHIFWHNSKSGHGGLALFFRGVYVVSMPFHHIADLHSCRWCRGNSLCFPRCNSPAVPATVYHEW